jgi:hypothetical protein
MLFASALLTFGITAGSYTTQGLHDNTLNNGVTSQSEPLSSISTSPSTSPYSSPVMPMATLSTHGHSHGGNILTSGATSHAHAHGDDERDGWDRSDVAHAKSSVD